MSVTEFMYMKKKQNMHEVGYYANNSDLSNELKVYQLCVNEPYLI